MSTYQPADEKRTAPADVDDPRDRRALAECMTALDHVGAARDAPGIYLVVSQSGREYTVDTHTRACTCPDMEYNDPGARGCKHLRRVDFATGARAIPAGVVIGDDVTIDPLLGAGLVHGAPRAVVPDHALDLDLDEDSGPTPDLNADATAGRPADCACAKLDLKTGLPCPACHFAGFDAPASAPSTTTPSRTDDGDGEDSPTDDSERGDRE